MTGGKVSEEGERRLDAMVRTNDGFQIAELDLELRGPGEFFGTRQAGMPSFQVANLIRDRADSGGRQARSRSRPGRPERGNLHSKRSTAPSATCARAGRTHTGWWRWAETIARTFYLPVRFLMTEHWAASQCL